MKTVAFFGHRRILNKKIIKEKLMKILQELISQGYSRVLIGRHGDFDDLALSTCLDYEKKYSSKIKINLVFTSLSFLHKDEYGYSKIDRYNDMGCETVFYDIEEVYFKERITFSNKKMIDDSDLIVCFVDMSAYGSGAKKAVSYALKQNKKVINLFDVE